jgi:hypothetical protein
MTRFILSLVLAIAVTSTCAMAQGYHRGVPINFGCDPSALRAAGYTNYNPCNDPNAAFVDGAYAGSDPDPNIRAALIREFSKSGGGRGGR